MEWYNMNDLRRPTFIPFVPQPSAQHHHIRHVTHANPPVKRRDFEAPTPQPEPFLLSLCRQEQWDQVLSRCETHPHEASPIVLKKSIEAISTHPWKRDRKSVSTQGGLSEESIALMYSPPSPVFEQTALGIVCGSAVSSDTKLRIIRVLIKASPQQLVAPQKIKGCTPLKDLMHSLVCEVTHLATLLIADPHLVAVSSHDMSGLTPIDHLVMRLHLDPCDRNVNLFRCYVDMVEKKSTSTSPMIRLLSLSRSPGLGNGNENKTFKAILECAKYLLHKNPARINDVSKSSGCSVLHIALRNFGDQLSLIQLLLDTSTNTSMLARRNVFGDLPLHVACAGGSPMAILKLIIAKSLEAAPMPAEGPHSLLWSTNYSGYTPVDLEWMRSIEGGGGLYERRTFYPLEERGLRCQSPCQEGLYRSLLRKAVGQVMNGNRDTCFFGALLDRIILIVQMAYSGNVVREENLLHAASSLAGASGPYLPQPLLFLFHWMHKEKTKMRDDKGRLPLHYSLMNHQSIIEESPNKPVKKETKDNVWVDMLIGSFPEGTKVADKTLRLPLHYALDTPCCNLEVVNKLILNHPESLERRDPITGLYPFQQAAESDLSTSFYLLRRAPNLVASSLHNS